MSHQLWQAYWQNDVERFRRLLGAAGYTQNTLLSKSPGAGIGSLGHYGSSPRLTPKPRKAPAAGSAALSKAEINSRDHAGLTILLRAASSTSETAIGFVEALLEHPAIDIYVQDPESGWNALHRAFYNGNISIARLLLDKERRDLKDSFGGATKVGQLIKTKDHEGNAPFDVYNTSIALRDLRMAQENGQPDDVSENEEAAASDEAGGHLTKRPGLGDEVFTFGSNKNLSLGLGDEDDRQYPERIQLRRPDHLIQYFHDEFLEERKEDRSLEDSFSTDDSEVPVLVQNRPLYVQDVVMSKFHTAVLTTDPVANLYVCGIGRGGRLGLGDENTRFNFMPVQGGLLDRHVTQVALGQNHSMAITTTGELWTWGSNNCLQLGYALPPPLKPDEEPISTTPRQVFGPLKKEVILGIAASAIHSVAHTGSSLFCWGKNVGQLGLMDADSRSLEIQTVPRKVAASLLSSHSSIVMVSAIDHATTCLFEDHTVCVLTNYGYNMVKFPLYDSFTNSPLQRSAGLSLSSRYDPSRREIHSITSGGETIAALTGSGDLYTMMLNHKVEGSSSATSTTNPAKIRDAVTLPQLLWSSGKDGVKSVTVGENGSVMISTQSGAVWRRIKRMKAKDTRTLDKRKDYKFQRVPYITDVEAVRSSTFGAYAAIRKDCDVTREQIEVDGQSFWDDLAALSPLRDFKAQNSKERENKDTWKFADPEYLRSRVHNLAYQVLISTDLEEDMKGHLRNWTFRNESLGAMARTSTAPIEVPVHPFVLAARSSVVRVGLQRVRECGSYNIPEVLTMTEIDGIIVFEFSGIDLITLLNVIDYAYTDRVIPTWNFTRQSPPLAYRYRQIRVEVMKVATKLCMSKLEHAARIQASPGRIMDQDFRKAIEDSTFFEDGDALLELDGDQIPVHSPLLCQRCPWFQGLFNGRSGGMWLASRRAGQSSSDRTPIDMKHFQPKAFHYVLQFLYADTGEELFDHTVAESIDEFSELVMDVMSIANELMLDRLSQICQKIIGRFVTTRNISVLLNFISPCAVREFVDKGLEYICLQMETMLENHLLDNLDEELLLELDQVVRDNQLARSPFARSGRADLLLHEKYPELAEDIDEERQRRVKEMAFRASQRDEDRKLSSSFKARFGSLEDFPTASPMSEKSRRSRAARNEPFSPDLRPRSSQVDLMFEIDDEESSVMASPASPSPRPLDDRTRSELERITPLPESSLPGPWRDAKGRVIEGSDVAIASTPVTTSMPRTRTPIAAESASTSRVSSGGNPWGSTPMPTARLDLREIMSEPKPTRSLLSAGLAQEAKQSAKSVPAKLSQKERKRFLQQQAEEAAREAQSSKQPSMPWTKIAEKKGSPWQSTPAAPKLSMKEAMASDLKSPSAPVNKPLAAAEASGTSIHRRAASPDTRFSGQARSGATTPRGNPTPRKKGPTPLQATPSQSTNKPLVPHSKSYIQKPPRPEVPVGLGLAEIIGQQQREQESIKEAVAKRSLQEIQQEQAFQEWWDQESRRMQEDEARKAARERGRQGKKEGGGGRRGRGGKSGGGAGAGAVETNAMPSPQVQTVAGGNNSHSNARGRSRGHRGGKA